MQRIRIPSAPLALALGLALPLACAAQTVKPSPRSSVTIFGILDVGASRLSSGDSIYLQSTDGYKSSRLGFRGVEDLGGGLSAGFHLEGALEPDTGNSGGFDFRRRATVSLSSKALGELRLGRDYTPTFWNLSKFSVFGTNGVGASKQLLYGFNGLSNTVPTIVRSNNSVGYHLPKLGGVYGQVMIAPGEGKPGKYEGLRVGYAGGGLDAAIAYGTTVANAAGDKFKATNVGASYDFGGIEVMGLYVQSELTSRKQTGWALGASYAVGAFTLRANVGDAHFRDGAAGSDYSGRIYAIGGVYDLSKRTALYATAARISNTSGGRFTIDGAPGFTPGRSSNGVEAGITHSF